MDTTLHAKMAGLVVQNLRDNYTLEIEEKEFKYGFIKPDINLNLRFKAHTKDEMMNDVISNMENLITNSHHINNKDFYDQLGIIMHYLGDFFCAAHNTHFDGGIFKHIYYEKTQNILHRSSMERIIKDVQNIGIQVLNTFKEIKNFLLKLHNEYLKEKINKKTDLIYCIKSILAISLSLITIRHTSLARTA